ncbi:uncharacterized protein LOC125235619 [Leguminivora glycinivorella]|uniref:uncharacterized protein LOC125235619 n=1 Tax=Leguminivora glycinivorella TaxID=1035111 RepID=UPI00200DC397|nr:uncharacterized protein LOC125235619 [Leguminivora glycinivorella]
MKSVRVAALALLAAGLISAEIQNLDLLRLLMERPMLSGHNRFDRGPSIEDRVDQLWHRKYGEDNRYSDFSGTSTKRSAVATALNAGRPRRQPAPALELALNTETRMLNGRPRRQPSPGLALALNTETRPLNGRPRRQPAPGLGKAITPFAGVGKHDTTLACTASLA